MNDYMKKINLSSISNRIERNKAKTFNDFIDLLNKEKYILNSKFKGMLINVNLICPNGCSYSVKPNNFKNLGQRCPCRSAELSLAWRWGCRWMPDTDWQDGQSR